LKNWKTQLQTQIPNLNSTISKVQKENQSFKDQVLNVRHENQSLNALILMFQEENQRFKDQISNVQHENQSLNTIILALQEENQKSEIIFSIPQKKIKD
jgi:septal ring factor EnvC (AmiA/AmiB activator)